MLNGRKVGQGVVCAKCRGIKILNESELGQGLFRAEVRWGRMFSVWK